MVKEASYYFSMMKYRLILICDTKNEIDDQMAIAYALNDPEIELLAIISTQNNQRGGINSTSIYHKEAQRILKLANSKVLALMGSTRLLIIDRPELSEGIQFILKAIKKDSNIIIACTGPATDIANLCLADKELAKKTQIIWLGGYKNQLVQKFFNNYEVNFRGDALAANFILKQDINLTVIPTFGTSHKIILKTNKLQQNLRKKGSPLCKYLASLIDWNWKRLGFNNKFIKPLLRYWIFCDIAAIAVAKKFGILKTTKIENQKVIQSINSKTIIKDFLEKLGV